MYWIFNCATTVPKYFVPITAWETKSVQVLGLYGGVMLVGEASGKHMRGYKEHISAPSSCASLLSLRMDCVLQDRWINTCGEGITDHPEELVPGGGTKSKSRRSISQSTRRPSASREL
ncbi:hypothetical protein XELAEV_18046939mg [Xenopus laevis]|uniref:Uncharacterized protein n=1 Tax=Xenopus laevis TaxID=8355 RepID=A0A974BUS2_XENLA|nr:hypothetical protein XELAEV_18046939mg [Xenopus laevis]